MAFGPKYSQPYRSPFLLIPPLLVIVAIIDNNDLIRIFTITDTFAALHDPCPPYLGLSHHCDFCFWANKHAEKGAITDIYADQLALNLLEAT